MSFAISTLLALSIPATGYLCPAAPEPSALASANFEMPAQGASISIGASASFQRTRFAIHISRPKPGGWSTLTVVRLVRGWDCNLHRLDQKWTVPIDAAETNRFFEEIDAWQRSVVDDQSITVDGTSVEFRRDDDGKWGPRWKSNGPSMSLVSTAALSLIRRHLPGDEVPDDISWKWKTSKGDR